MRGLSRWRDGGLTLSTILMRTDLLADARVARLASLTRVSKIRVVGGLYWLWSVAQTQSTDGVLKFIDETMVDEQTDIPGFAKALVSVNWISLRDDSVMIPDFESYFGKSAKTRAKERLKKARQRWNAPNEDPSTTITPEGGGDKKGTQGGQEGDKEGTASGHVGASDRIGSDRSGAERIGADPISPPNVRELTSSASRFLANRQNATGNTPEGFAAFVKAYPVGLALDDDGMLAIWRARGLEEIRDEVLAGLAKWNASEKFQTGHAPSAMTFLTRGDWTKEPPPPKPVATPPEKVRYW